MSNLAHLHITIDPIKVEAVRVAVTLAVRDSEKVYGRWITVAEKAKDAWPTEGLMDKPLVTQWIVAALSESEQAILATPTDEATDKKGRKAVQDKVSQYVKRTVERAYPAPVAVKPALEITPEQAEANAAQVIAAQAVIDKTQTAATAAQAVTNSKIAKSEAATAILKAKAAEAAAKLDPMQAEAAAEAKAEAEVKAEAAEAEAAIAEAAIAEDKAAKVLMVAAQTEAKNRADIVSGIKIVGIVLEGLDALIKRVQENKGCIKGGEDLEAALIGARTDLQIDNSL